MNNNKKYVVIAGAIVALQFPFHALAQNIIRSQAPVTLSKETELWVPASSAYSEWLNNGPVKNCRIWTPDISTVPIGHFFEQIANDCEQDQVRTVQPREQSTKTQVYRDAGVATTELRTINATMRREAVGTQESWTAASPFFTEWTNEGGIYECQTWSPDPSTVTVEQAFTQTSNDCKQNQTRTRQDREQEAITLQYRDVGDPIMESRSIAASQSRASVGSKETWIAATPDYGAWVNTGSVYGCSNWSPSPSSVNSGVSFTQNATDCKIDQTRPKQDREQETTTLAYRNVGAVQAETQTLTGQSSSRQAVGTKSAKVCLYDDSFNPGYHSYYTNGSYAFLWTNGYSSVPSLGIIDAKTGLDAFGGTPIPGFSRVSNTEFRYNDGNKVWKITSGAYVKALNGYSHYQICFE